MALAILAYNVAGYFTLNRLEVERLEVPRIPFLDEAPLLPWTILVYLSSYLQVGAAILLLESRREVWRYAFSTFIAFTMTFTIFALLPTRMSRTPLPAGASLWRWGLELTRALDEPHTCLPSLHVVSCVLAALSVRRRVLRRVFLFWSLAICASTLTTSQHVFLDLPSGALVGLLGHAAGRVLQAPPRPEGRLWRRGQGPWLTRGS